MSKYTTGEIAKLCFVTVRTVQYYDSRGILSPSELSEGGRRLYSEEDLNKMKIICFLRDLDIPIASIKDLFTENDPEKVISILIEQQQTSLSKEIAEKKEQLTKLETLSVELKGVENFSVESIGDIAQVVENKKKLRHFRIKLFIAAIISEIMEILSFVLLIKTGRWLPFSLGMILFLSICIWIVSDYYKRIAYICPQCHTVFKPKFMDFCFSSHTLKTRKLTCTHCSHRGFCVETCNTVNDNPHTK